MKKKQKKKSISGWTIKIWWYNGDTEFVDTSDMPDDVAQGIDDYLYDKYERSTI